MMGLACEEVALEPYTFPDMVRAYLQSLRRKPSYEDTCRQAKYWLLTLTECPTRQQVKARHARIGPDGLPGTGHYQPLAASANKEISILRAAIHFGIDAERWTGGNPTIRIRKWKIARRKRVFKFLEIKTILQAMEAAQTPLERRDRALFGLMLFTGCRPSEAREAKRGAISPYGRMGLWNKPHTKTGEPQEVPVPWQLMDWLKVMPDMKSPWLFVGFDDGEPLTDGGLRQRWRAFRKQHGISSSWTYDFRRSLATYLITIMKESDTNVQAILNHTDGRSLGHYAHPTFDTLCPIIQHYADWLFSLKTMQQDVAYLPMNAPAIEPVAMMIGG